MERKIEGLKIERKVDWMVLNINMGKEERKIVEKKKKKKRILIKELEKIIKSRIIKEDKRERMELIIDIVKIGKDREWWIIVELIVGFWWGFSRLIGLNIEKKIVNVGWFKIRMKMIENIVMNWIEREKGILNRWSINWRRRENKREKEVRKINKVIKMFRRKEDKIEYKGRKKEKWW